MSEYRLQVVEVRTGKVVQAWAPGGPVETDLVMDLCGRLQHKGWEPSEQVVQGFLDGMCLRLQEKGVGMFRSEARVLEAVREAFAEQSLPQTDQLTVLSAVRESWAELLLGLKSRV